MPEPRDTTGNDALNVCPNCDTPRVIGRHGSSDCIVALRAARERWRLNATEAYDERDRFRRERDEFRMTLRGMVRAHVEGEPAYRKAIQALADVAGREEGAKADVE